MIYQDGKNSLWGLGQVIEMESSGGPHVEVDGCDVTAREPSQMENIDQRASISSMSYNSARSPKGISGIPECTS